MSRMKRLGLRDKGVRDEDGIDEENVPRAARTRPEATRADALHAAAREAIVSESKEQRCKEGQVNPFLHTHTFSLFLCLEGGVFWTARGFWRELLSSGLKLLGCWRWRWVRTGHVVFFFGGRQPTDAGEEGE